MHKITIGIIDDHQAIAQGLCAALVQTGEYEVLFTVSQVDKIGAALADQLPELLIMDVVMPGSQGIENFKEVLRQYPDLKVIAYTALNSPLLIELLFKSGVKGYVGKNQPLEDILTAVSEVYFDRLSLPSDYSFILKKLRDNDKPDALSKREIEVLQLIAKEHTTTEIAESLHISVNTVESHRKHLFAKLQVNNLAGLIKAGFDQGYLH